MKLRWLNLTVLILVMGLFLLSPAPLQALGDGGDGSIRPYSKNPWYWQYQIKPVILIGGTNDDNLFQWNSKQLTDHLDLLLSVGGNYVRNTMSDRDKGNLFAFKEIKTGVYDLNIWNNEYWERLSVLLDETEKRGIIVQLTFWDEHDLINGDQWRNHPWNPKNNINIKEGSWTNHSGFFATIDLNNQQGLFYQQKYVDKILSVTLRYKNVLYNINNESRQSVQWENYWATYVKKAAKKAGREIYIASMQFDPISSVRHFMTYREIYDFVEISQNNQDSRGGRGQGHWDNIMYWRDRILNQAHGPAPMNNEKVYGATDGTGNFSMGTETEAINRLWRNIFAGCATSRFHRPGAGSGLNERVQTNLRAMTMLLQELDIFSCSPQNNLLSHVVAVFINKPDEKSNYPSDDHVRFDVNSTNTTLKISLDGKYVSVDGKIYIDTYILEPYSSVILIKNSDNIPSAIAE